VLYLGTTELTPEQHAKINTAADKSFLNKLLQLRNDGSIALIFSHKSISGKLLDSTVTRLAKAALVVSLFSS
jgi:hypothetical protein